MPIWTPFTTAGLSAANPIAGSPTKASLPKSRRVCLLTVRESMPLSLAEQRIHDKVGKMVCAVVCSQRCCQQNGPMSSKAKLWLPDMDSNHELDRILKSHNLLILQSPLSRQKQQKQAFGTKSVQKVFKSIQSTRDSMPEMNCCHCKFKCPTQILPWVTSPFFAIEVGQELPGPPCDHCGSSPF